MDGDFHERLKSECQHVLSYEDPKAQDEVKKVVPIDRLEKAAKDKFEQIKKEKPDVDDEMYRDLLLLELMKWFKEEFFEWFDQPLCDDGKTKAKFKGPLSPTEQERTDGASRVEG